MTTQDGRDGPDSNGLSFAEIDPLLDHALQLDEPAQRDFLLDLGDEQRKIVESLLSRTSSTELDGMANTVAKALTHMVDASSPENGRTAGRWQLKHQLGSGGMGQVFFAIREEHGYIQRAAVKVLWSHRIGSDFRARFFRERRILASLDHPGLARFLDGGLLADGRPWFAMEFVDGVDVIEYAEHLPLLERLNLFLTICTTLEFAHQRLIVHRDIKPQNVLIDESGRARLLDFGVASILDDIDDGVHTRTGGSPITLQYASPEQVTGSLVAVASDVYQLGLLLYQMLSGRLPYGLEDQSLQQAIQTICQEPPDPPSVLAPEIARDLDAIVLCALRKEPSQRYRSVAMFAEDIRRHVDGRPVLAQPASPWYVAKRFVQRNALLLSVVAVSVIALAAATVVSLNLAQQAQAEARRSRATQQILANVFQQADPFGNAGADVTLSEALIAARPSIEEQIRDDPRLAWEVNKTFADIFTSLGLVEQEVGAYKAALAAARQLEGSSENEIMLAIDGWGNALVRTNPGEAVEFFGQHLPASPADRESVEAWLSAKYAQINAFARLQMFDQADLAIGEMAQVVHKFDVSAPRSRARLSQLLAGRARRAGDIDAADRQWRDAVEHMSQADIPGAHAVLLSNMAIHLGRTGRYEESGAAFRQSLQVFSESAPDDPSHGSVLRAYAGLLFRMGQQTKAIDTLHEALAILDGSDQSYTSYVALVNLATYTFAIGETEHTSDAIARGLSLALDEFGPDSNVTGRILSILAELLLFAQQNASGMALLQFNSDAVLDDPTVDAQHLALTLGALDVGQLEQASAAYSQVVDPESADSQRVLLRLSCALGSRTTMATLLEDIGQPVGTDYATKHFRIWIAWAAAALAIDAGDNPALAIVEAAASYRDNQDVFLSVLDQHRVLRGLEQLARSAEAQLPADLRQRLNELEQLKTQTRGFLGSDRATGLRSLLPALSLSLGRANDDHKPDRMALCKL